MLVALTAFVTLVGWVLSLLFEAPVLPTSSPTAVLLDDVGTAAFGAILTMAFTEPIRSALR